MGIVLLVGGKTLYAAHPAAHEEEISLSGPTFDVGGLTFTIPAKWQSEPVDNPARAAQWHIPLAHGQVGEGGEVVVFYFGQGVGGGGKENIDAWIGTMSTAEGHPATAEVTNHTVNGFKISQAVIFGTYNQVVSLPGIPPRPKPNYGLVGVVIENPQGNIYWRFTGPAALITVNLPLFNKITESVKP